MEAIGPTTVTALSNRLGIEAPRIESALLSLEGAGMVLRGRFTPSTGSAGEIEWCDRVLLARIHRLTLGRMRREIEPVSPVEFMSFLLSWQHVGVNRQFEGRDGVLRVIQQLQGLELPAPAWEQSVLPTRVRNYSPADLEHLCLAGVVAWGRLRAEQSSDDNLQGKLPARRRLKRLATPARNAPIAFLMREDLDYFLVDRSPRWAEVPTLSSSARDVARYLEQRGASFVSDIARGAGLLKIKVEEALWELVAHGLATGDGIAGLRLLLLPEHKRQGKRHNLRVISGGRSAARMMPVGRWSLWSNQNGDAEVNSEQIIERQARQLLERYGVVFRDLLAREANLPPWRSLLTTYRRLEARGEIRGGRFVNGFVGEQFALPVAIEKLRAERRADDKQQPFIVSAADPLNLVGILTPGGRVSPYSNQVIAYHKGLPVQVGPLGSVLSNLQLHHAGEKP